MIDDYLEAMLIDLGDTFDTIRKLGLKVMGVHMLTLFYIGCCEAYGISVFDDVFALFNVV